jgi:HIRAN domain
MISFLKRIFSGRRGIKKNADIRQVSQPKTKEFKFLILDDHEVPPKNLWYRRSRWYDSFFLRMDTEWSNDWKNYSLEERVVGVSYEDRARQFIILGDQPDFTIYLEREPTNTYDKNAIRVMGKATVDGNNIIEQLGYLSKETAAGLKDEKELDARPYSVYLPHEEQPFGLRIRVLVRSQAYYKKKRERTDNK